MNKHNYIYHTRYQRPLIKYICSNPECKKEFESKSKRKYCCPECYQKTLNGSGNPFYKKKHTQETKKIISIKNTGNISWSTGKTKDTDPIVKQISDKLKNRVRTLEHCKNISINKIGKRTSLKGQTKETCPGIMVRSLKLKGRKHLPTHIENNRLSHLGQIPVNKGLTKDNCEYIKVGGDKCSNTKKKLFSEGKLKVWNDGKTKKDHPSIASAGIKTSQRMKGVNTYIRTPEYKKQRSIDAIKYFKEHPEKLGNHVLAKRGKVTIPQRKMFDVVKSYFPDAVLEYPVNTDRTTHFVDVAVPSKNFAFEFNGSYFHQDPSADESRAHELFAQEWYVFFFNEENLHKLTDVIEGCLVDG